MNNIYDYFKDLDSLFNNFYILDLLINKNSNFESIYLIPDVITLKYNNFTINFYDTNMNIYINLLNQKIIDKLKLKSFDFSYFIKKDDFFIYDNIYKIEGYGISYDNIEQIKELILEIYNWR